MRKRQCPRDEVQATLKRIRALFHPAGREQQRSFYIEGVRNFVQAVDAGLTFDTVVISPVLLKCQLAQTLARRIVSRGVRRVRVTPEEFRAHSVLERASGIGAIVQQPWTELDVALPDRGICWLVIEQIRSPGNLGTILRTAEATSVGGAIFVGPKCDPFHPAVVRASMGAICHVPLVRATHARLSGWIRQHNVHVVGLSPEADRLWISLPSVRPLAFVLGDERRGLSDPMRQHCAATVRLPMSGRADSLNVSVAAGVMMYELVRRASLVNDSR